MNPRACILYRKVSGKTVSDLVPQTVQKQTQTKQTTRTGTESQKWRSHGGLSVGLGGGRMREKVQGMRSINGRYKIDRGRLRKYRECRSQRTYMYDPRA